MKIFPTNLERQAAWAALICRPNWRPSKNCVLCSPWSKNPEATPIHREVWISIESMDIHTRIHAANGYPHHVRISIRAYYGYP